MDSKTEMVQEGVPPQVVTGQPHPGQPLSVPRDPPAPYVQYTASRGPTAAVAPGVVQQEQLPSSSMVGTIVCSCIVTWFCCLPLGLISFILASKLISAGYEAREGGWRWILLRLFTSTQRSSLDIHAILLERPLI